MRLRALIPAILISFISHISLAGIPMDEKMTCPVGGEKFKIESTVSCSTMGRTISLQPVTSCDFITHLPQCPKNKLPMYKDFSDVELSELKSIMETDDYKGAATKSRYFLAATIEKSLPATDELSIFFLLQNGLWYTPDQSIDDPEYMQAYHEAAKKLLADDKFEDKAFWRGAQAFVYIRTGDLGAAGEQIELMKTENTENNEYLSTYTNALSYCLAVSNDEDMCSPNTPIRAHEAKNKTK